MYMVVSAAPAPSPPPAAATSRWGHTHAPIRTSLRGSRRPAPEFAAPGNRRSRRADDDPTRPRQLSLSSRATARGEGSGGGGRKCGSRRRDGWERVVAGRRWGSHDSLGDGGDGLNRGGWVCGKREPGGVGVLVKAAGSHRPTRPRLTRVTGQFDRSGCSPLR